MIAESGILLVAGCLCAALGGELFLHGLVGLARQSGIPKSILAGTIGAFATSTPELVVGITSALEGVPEIALGNALGANIVNVCLVLGIPIVAFGLTVMRNDLWRELPFAVAVFPMLSLLCFDGVISRSEAPFLLPIFLGWAITLAAAARRERVSPSTDTPHPETLTFVTIVALVGLLTLLLAGHLIVEGATSIALAAGVPAFVVGATVVALGTSTPELATVLVSMYRGHREVGLSAILGSNIFNCLFIVAIAASISPITVSIPETALALAIGLIATVLIFPFANSARGRTQGTWLLAIYVLFICANVLVAGYA